MATILSASGSAFTARPDDVAAGEAQTSNGLALSPTMAAMCANDFVRTIKFLRGTQAAIVDTRKRFPERPARVLYVGCGPYATLAVPLMTIFRSTEAAFTVLEVQPESLESAISVVDTLGLAGSVTSFERVDATSYSVRPDRPPDIVVMEIMRGCLESEPQVAITRHLLSQAPDAISIPDEVRVELTLVDPSREFDLSRRNRREGPSPPARVAVATVFVLNREVVDSWSGEPGNRLPAAVVRIPDQVEPRYEAMLSTRIRVYRSHVLEDDDSGLTCPIALPQGLGEPGQAIRFHYELGGRPGLRGEVVHGAAERSHELAAHSTESS